jgi:hypothetical protein
MFAHFSFQYSPYSVRNALLHSSVSLLFSHFFKLEAYLNITFIDTAEQCSDKHGFKNARIFYQDIFVLFEILDSVNSDWSYLHLLRGCGVQFGGSLPFSMQGGGTVFWNFIRFLPDSLVSCPG